MARELTLACPGDLNTLTGGYIYDKRILAELQALGWAVQVLRLDDRFPHVDESIRQDTARQLAAVDHRQILVIDGLALGALGAHAKTIRDTRPFVALVHHPLALESGVDPATAKNLHQSERHALSYAQHVIVTSQLTRQTLIEQYDVYPENVTVIEPGVDLPDRALSSCTETHSPANPLRLLSVGAIVPRKGFDILVNALGMLGELDWHLTIVGDQGRSVACTKELSELIGHLNLSDRIHMTGALPEPALAEQYRCADVFVLASLYEGYGMAYSEALAWGIPVVGTDGGAAAQTLATPAAKIVPAGNVEALAATLRALMSNPELRSQMRQAALDHALALPSWKDSGIRFAQTLCH